MTITGEIYIISNKINGKQYVGQTLNYYSNGRKNGSKKRFQKHISNALNHKDECRLISQAIRKYGQENFELEVLDKCEMNMLNEYEDIY